MLSFLNSGILAALLAVAIPLLIHLINRQNRTKMKFSTLRFLRTIEEQRIRRIKLFQILLIILRSLIIVLLVLSFARPAIKSKSVLAGTAAGRTAVIILDNGINMQAYDQAGSRFKRAKEKALLIRQQFTENDDLLIIPARQPENILADSVQLAAVPFSYCGADWPLAFKTAREYFQAHPNYQKDLFIISDFQFHDPTFNNLLPEFRDIRIYLITIFDHRINNISIDTVSINNRIFEAGQTLNLDARVHNSTPAPDENTELHLFVNGQRIAYQKFNLQPLESKNINLSCLLKSDKKLEGYLELNDDDLAGDNRYYFALTLPDSILVLFVEEQNSPYLEAAFNSIESNTNIRFTRAKYASWAGKRFEQFQVLFLSNMTAFPPVLINRLRTYLDQGGSLILMPGDRTDLSAFNRMCTELKLNFRVTERRETGSGGEYYSLKAGDWQQPVFSDIFRKLGAELSSPAFSKYFKVISGSGNDILISFNTGDPFILNLAASGRSVFLICSFIDDQWTDFQFKGPFIPLLLRLILLGATNVDQLNRSLTIGQPAVLPLKLPESNRELYIRSAAGDNIKIIPAVNNRGIVLDHEVLQVPGNYKLLGAAEELATVSVNASTHSLIPPYTDVQALAADLPGGRLVREDDDPVDLIRKNHTGIELFNILIFLVIITLFMEIVLIKKTEGLKLL